MPVEEDDLDGGDNDGEDGDENDDDTDADVVLDALTHAAAAAGLLGDAVGVLGVVAAFAGSTHGHLLTEQVATFFPPSPPPPPTLFMVPYGGASSFNIYVSSRPFHPPVFYVFWDGLFLLTFELY